MAFRYDEMGQLVVSKPAEASRRLARLFAEHRYNHGDVAEALGVNTATLYRWRQKLVERGVADPSKGKRAPRRQPGPRSADG